MSISILQESDYEDWAELWRQYLEFYKTVLPETQYMNTWSRIRDKSGEFYAFVIRDDGGRLVGLAHYLFHANLWSSKPSCYLNDLFVHSSTRGKGFGRKLILAVKEAAIKHGCDRYYWATQESNAIARRLYDSLAELEFVMYSMKV